ncbi:MAG: alcohol dehydrogenase catalytic domain-containing protein [Spirochaetes bacterium]|nr:alcohol dehydrogenase catalytic domain-containing protein [Spirochaetota bacterium]
MKAAILEAQNKIAIKNVADPVCGDNEAILKVKACAVCGSDVRIYHYGNDRVKYPSIIGHEIAGEIVTVGKNVSKVKVGDRIALGADVPCGECYWCANGMGTNCSINYAIGYQFAGGFQEYMTLNDTILKYGPVTKMPDSLSFEEAAIAEPLACAINGLELAQFAPGKSLAVIGLGPIGCMMLELSKMYGAKKVFAIQRSKNRLAMAKTFREDARFIASADEDPVAVVLKETNGEGVDCAVTTAGTTEAQEAAIQMIRHRGFVNLFGGLKNQPKLSIDSNIIHYRECYVMGSHGSLPRHHELAVSLIAQDIVSAKKYISKTFPLDEISSAFSYHEERGGLKVIVTPNAA